MRIRPCGDSALLLEFDHADEVLAARQTIAAADIAGITELVPAAQTVLVQFEPGQVSGAKVRIALEQLEWRTPVFSSKPDATVRIPVHYDGADLADVADRTNLTIDEVIARHSNADYTVAFCGFAPGFGYLTGLDPRLQLPRRDNPRTRVPAGAVAIAGPYSAVYPNTSPGGWHLLGRTDEILWDPARRDPARLKPGIGVRFEPIGGSGHSASGSSDDSRHALRR